MAEKYTVVGFSTSTAQARNRRQWKLYDLELIQRDLLNHFNTKVGERLGRPTFGSRIFEYLMEQRSDYIIDQIREEIERVVRHDPRIVYEGLDLIEIDRGVIATVHLSSDLFNGIQTLQLLFDERQSVATRG